MWFGRFGWRYFQTDYFKGENKALDGPVFAMFSFSSGENYDFPNQAVKKAQNVKAKTLLQYKMAYFWRSLSASRKQSVLFSNSTLL
ncbi:MAG TPA: hypothetical protein PLW66_08675 [Saprospiraceae bacterium]|nr:hypothetical protein [Saprospiraceae bacterium]